MVACTHLLLHFTFPCFDREDINMESSYFFTVSWSQVLAVGYGFDGKEVVTRASKEFLEKWKTSQSPMVGGEAPARFRGGAKWRASEA
jgi:hypothetical protein